MTPSRSSGPSVDAAKATTGAATSPAAPVPDASDAAAGGAAPDDSPA